MSVLLVEFVVSKSFCNVTSMFLSNFGLSGRRCGLMIFYSLLCLLYFIPGNACR